MGFYHADFNFMCEFLCICHINFIIILSYVIFQPDKVTFAHMVNIVSLMILAAGSRNRCERLR